MISPLAFIWSIIDFNLAFFRLNSTCWTVTFPHLFYFPFCYNFRVSDWSDCVFTCFFSRTCFSCLFSYFHTTFTFRSVIIFNTLNCCLRCLIWLLLRVSFIAMMFSFVFYFLIHGIHSLCFSFTSPCPKRKKIFYYVHKHFSS